MSDLGNCQIMAENIRYFMDLNRKTRKDVCSALNFSYSTFSDWYNGKKYPRIDKIELLANYFGIEKKDLVEKRTEKEKASDLTETKKHLLSLIESMPDDKAERLLSFLQN